MRTADHSKLIHFLSSLTKEDRRRFREYIATPLFNKLEEPKLLYGYIEKHCLGKEIREIADEEAVAYIREHQNFPADKLRKVKHALLKLFMDYLEFRHWQGHPGERKTALVKELNRMDERRFFPQYYKKGKSSLEKSQDIKPKNYLHRLEMESELMIHLQGKGGRSEDNHLEDTVNALEKHLLAYILKYTFVANNQFRIIGRGSLPNWIKTCSEEIAYGQLAEEPYLQIYFLLNQTLKPATELGQLSLLKSLIVTHAADFEATEVYDIYTGALNNFLQQRQVPRRELLENLFELYGSMVEVYAKGKKQGLLPAHFKNIVSVGCQLGRFGEVLGFLEEGGKLIAGEGEDVERTLDFNWGVYRFYQGDYKEAERRFHRVLPGEKDIFVASDTRAYLLMCFYERGDTMGMEALVHSFRMFLSRSKRVSESHRDIYLSFVRLFRKVLATPPNDDARLQELKSDIEKLKFSAGKAWLSQKAAEI